MSPLHFPLDPFSASRAIGAINRQERWMSPFQISPFQIFDGCHLFRFRIRVIRAWVATEVVFLVSPLRLEVYGRALVLFWSS